MLRAFGQVVTPFVFINLFLKETTLKGRFIRFCVVEERFLYNLCFLVNFGKIGMVGFLGVFFLDFPTFSSVTVWRENYFCLHLV